MFLDARLWARCPSIFSSIAIELKVDVQYIHSGINIVKFSDNSLFYWRFGQLWTDNAPYVTNEPPHDKTKKVTMHPVWSES